MSEQPTPAARVAPQPASRPGTISYVIMGIALIAFVFFVFSQ
jgi:hypothetical protein